MMIVSCCPQLQTEREALVQLCDSLRGNLSEMRQEKESCEKEKQQQQERMERQVESLEADLDRSRRDLKDIDSSGQNGSQESRNFSLQEVRKILIERNEYRARLKQMEFGKSSSHQAPQLEQEKELQADHHEDDFRSSEPDPPVQGSLTQSSGEETPPVEGPINREPQEKLFIRRKGSIITAFLQWVPSFHFFQEK